MRKRKIIKTSCQQGIKDRQGNGPEKWGERKETNAKSFGERTWIKILFNTGEKKNFLHVKDEVICGGFPERKEGEQGGKLRKGGRTRVMRP